MTEVDSCVGAEGICVNGVTHHMIDKSLPVKQYCDRVMIVAKLATGTARCPKTPFTLPADTAPS